MNWIISIVQVLVCEFIAVQIQNDSVFSHHLCKKSVKLPSIFFFLTNTKVVWYFICYPNPHL